MILFQDKVDNTNKAFWQNVYDEMVRLNDFMKSNGVQTTVFTQGQLARVKHATECDKIDPRAMFAVAPHFKNMVSFASANLYGPVPDQNIILMYMMDNKTFMRGGNFKNTVDRGYVEKLKEAINTFLPNPDHIKQKPKLVGPPIKRTQVHNDNENRADNDNQRYRKGVTYTFKKRDRFVKPNKETLQALLLYAEAERELYSMGVGGVEHVDNQNPTQNYGDRLIVKTIEVIKAYINAPFLKESNDLAIRAKALEHVEKIKGYMQPGTRIDALYAAFNDAKKRGALKGSTTKAIGRGEAAQQVLASLGIKLEDVLVDSEPIDAETIKKVEKMR